MTEEETRKLAHEVITFNVRCTMKRRWARQFLGMLEYMQRLGSWGSSRTVSFFADGDGDFRPKFEAYGIEITEPAPGLETKDSENRRPHEGDRHWDAG
jgi:hypothetical protein